jgi:hypothetical protein
MRKKFKRGVRNYHRRMRVSFDKQSFSPTREGKMETEEKRYRGLLKKRVR